MSHKVNFIHNIAMVLVLIGTLLYTIGQEFGWMIEGIGAFTLVLTRLYMRAKTTDRNLMRQYSIMMFGAILLLGAAYLMQNHKQYWILPILIDSIIELYISYRIRG